MKVKSILFFSRFPVNEKQKTDGEMQRVLIVDRLAQRDGYLRTYVHLEFFSLQARTVGSIGAPGVQVHFFPVLNPRVWRKVICLIKDCDIAYFHSIHNYKYAWLFGPWIKRVWTVLDLHGVVPEENAFIGQSLKAAVYRWLEQRAMRRLNRFVSVSLGMVDHFISKYPFLDREKFSLLPMVRGAESPYDPALEKVQRSLLDLPFNVPVAIYAGNTQKWQNVDMMLDLIASCGERMRFIVLSSAVEDFHHRLLERGIKDVIVRHVTQDEIHKYYCVASYGFLLRDDTVVNNVANPTKLVEYLKYGIVPVVVTRKTGDLEVLDVEFLLAEDFLAAHLSTRRSVRNSNVFFRHYCEDNYHLATIIAEC